MVNGIFLLKPIADMFWSIKALNSLLIAFVFLYAMGHLFRVKLDRANVAVFLLSILFLRAVLASADEGSITIFAKVISAFFLFYLAQFSRDAYRTTTLIGISFIVPVLYILFLAAIGQGYQYWGDAYTFSGPYFYKTDLAIAVVLSVIYFRSYLLFGSSKAVKGLVVLYTFVIAPKLILMANSRMTLVVYAIVLICFFVEYCRYKKVRMSSLKRNVIVISALCALIGGYLVYVNYYLPQNALMIQVDSEDVFSASNTQGRSEIWSSITGNFFSGGRMNVLFGYKMMSDHKFDEILHADAHNTFLKVMVSTGLAGLFCYVLFIGYVAKRLHALFKAYKDEPKPYFMLMTVLMVFLFFVLSGISQSNIIFTQSSWYVFYCMGLLFNTSLFPKAIKEVRRIPSRFELPLRYPIPSNRKSR